MKKLLAVLSVCVVFCLSMGLVACGGKKSSSSVENPTSTGDTSGSQVVEEESSTPSVDTEGDELTSETTSESLGESDDSSDEKELLEMKGITLTDESMEYDTLNHSLQIVGNVPQGSTITYYYNNVLNVNNVGVSAVGKYAVRVEITNTAYKSLTLTAMLTIKATEEELRSAVYGGKVYFQNNLDDNKLYSYSSGTLSQVNTDVPSAMNVNDGLYYVAKGLFSSDIKTIDSTGKVSSVYSVGAKSLATDAEGNLYYSVCGLIANAEKDGIYKIASADLSNGDDIVPVRICAERTQSIVYANGKIYFIKQSGKALCSVSTSAVNQAATVVYPDNVNELIANGNILYMNIGGFTGKALYKLNTTNNVLIKLTADNGQYLTVVGAKLYYVNHDLLTSTLFGDGIYSVDTNKTSDSSLSGSKLLEANDNGYSSLSSDGMYLYYYKLNDKHFYRATTSGGEETDLMKNFKVSAPTRASLNQYLRTTEHNGELYYIHADDANLYKYDPMTGNKVKVLTQNVSGMWFNGDAMYYSTYVLTNYALWRVNLTTNEEPVKVSSDRCENLIFEGAKIYYVKVGATASYAHVMDTTILDEKGLYKDFEVFDTRLNIYDFVKVGDSFLYSKNPTVGYDSLRLYNSVSKKDVELSGRVQFFTVSGDLSTVYYYNNKDNQIESISVNGGTATTLISDVEVNDIVFANGKLYYSSTAQGATGLYCYDLATKEEVKLHDKAVGGITVTQRGVYFMEGKETYLSGYPTISADESGSLYYYAFNTSNAQKIA